jgi:hypothetical protein
VPAQVRVEQRERLLADLEPPLDRRAAGEPAEARAADPAHHPLLLEREPLEHVRAPDAVGGEERRVLGEVPEDRRRLGDRLAGVELQHGRLAQRVERRERVGERLAGEDVDRDPLVLAPEEGEQQAHLVAVAGAGVVVEPHGPCNVQAASNVSDESAAVAWSPPV